MRNIRRSELVKIAQAHQDADYDYVGVRVQEQAEEVGSVLTHRSHIWDDGEDLGEELDGVCAVGPHARPDDISGYFGTHILVLGAYSAEYGQDDGELILHDPVVLACIEV